MACLLTLAGCEPEQEAGPIDTGPKLSVSENLSGDSRYIWEQEPKPYVIDDLVIRETAKDQQRLASVVIEYPQTKEEVQVAAREIFDAYWEDITDFGASKFQRIKVRVFCCKADAIDDDGFHIFEAEGGGLSEPVLPKFDQARKTWQWREPNDKPDDETLKVFREYWDEQQNIPGDDPAAEAQLVKRLAASHSLSVEEVAARIAATWLWRNRLSVNEKRIAYEVKQSLERWELDK